MRTAARIDLGDARAVRYWCKELGVLPAELRHLVAIAGPAVDDVKVALASIAPLRWLSRSPRVR